MAEGFPIYADLIVKSDPTNLNQIQAQLRQTFSSNSLNIDISKAVNLNQLRDAVSKVGLEAKGLIGTFDDLGERVTRVFGRFSAYLIASGGILGAVSLLRDATSQALKFNSELIRIRQVSGDSESSVRALGNEVGRLAQKYGVSSQELIKSAVTLKQAGLSVRETKVALETLAQADVAPNFDNMAKTTEGLIAIYQQFGKNIDNIKGQLGSLNAVAGEFAVEASDLITLFQKAGGAAKSAGADFNELMGLFTAVRATTRESADSIATGLRTIFGRLQRPDTIKFLDDLGIKMRYTAEEAKAAGKNVGDFVGPFEAIMRLSEATSNINPGSPLFANIVEQVGGLRQLSRVIPLIKEATLAREAYFVGVAGENSLYVSALQKQDDYLNRLTKLKEQFLSIARVLVQSEGFERFASTLGMIAKAATETLNAISPLIPTLLTLSTINFSMGVIKNLGASAGAALGLRNYPSTERRFASGGIVPGHGNTDSYPAVLMPGEAVIPKKQVSRFPQLISGLISGNIQGFSRGLDPNAFIGGATPSYEDVKRALIDFAKRTGLSPEGLFGSITLDPNLRSKSHPGRLAKGRATSRGNIQLNPGQFTDYNDFLETVFHELGHRVDAIQNIRQNKDIVSYLNHPDTLKKYEEYARKNKQSFVPQGPLGIPYAMKLDERIANAFAMNDQNVIRSTDEQRTKAFDYVQRNTRDNTQIFNNLVEKEFGGYVSSYGNKASGRAQSIIASHQDKIATMNLAMGQLANSNFSASDKKYLKTVYSEKISQAQSQIDKAQELLYRIANRSPNAIAANTIPNINEAANLYNAGGQNVASYGNGPIGAFGYGRNPPSPPIGPFGYGRGGAGGAGGGSGSGGNTGGGAGAGGIPPEEINRAFGLRRFGHIVSTLGGFGIPLAAGIGASYATSPDTQHQLTAVSSYAGIGAGLGSAAGPFGILGGALIGGLIGWLTSGAAAAKELEKNLSRKKLDASITELNQVLEEMASGKGSLQELADSLEKTKKSALGEAILRAKNGDDFSTANREEFQKAAGVNLARYQKEITEKIREQAKNGQGLDIESGPIKSILEDIVALRQRPGKTFTFANVRKESEDTYRAARIEQNRIEAARNFDIEINRSVASASAFADSVKRAADAATDLDKNIKVITGGGYAGASFNIGEYGAVDKGTLGRLGTVFNGNLSGLTETVGSVNTISQYLPDVLSRIIKPGDPKNTNITSISSEFSKVFDEIGKASGISFDKKVIGVIGHKLESMKGEELFEDFRKAPEQFAQNLIKSYEPSLKALESIGKNLERRDEVYQQGLQTLLQLNDKINHLAEAKVGLSIHSSDISMQLALRGAGLDPSRFVNMSGVTGAFGAEQSRLLGVGGIGTNVAAITARIRQEESVRDNLRRQASEEANSGSPSTKFRDALLESEKRLGNYNKALENLTKRSEELSRLQQIVNINERQREAKMGLKTSIITANPDQLLSMNRDYMTAGLVTRLGIAGTRQLANQQLGPLQGPYLAADMLTRTHSLLTGPLKDIPLYDRVVDGKKVKGTGEDAWRALVGQITGKIPDGLKEDPNVKAIKDALEESKNIINTSSAALSTMSQTVTNQQNSLYQTLKDNNNEFFNKVDELINTLKDNALRTDEGVKRTRLNELQPDIDASKVFSGNRVDDLKLNKVQERIDAIKKAKAAGDEFNLANQNSGDMVKQALDFIKNNPELSSREIAGKLGGMGFENISSIEGLLPNNKAERDEKIKNLIGQKNTIGSINAETGENVYTPADKKRLKDIDIEIERLQNGGGIDPTLSEKLKDAFLSPSRERYNKARAGLDPRMLGLSDKEIEFAASKKNPALIIAEYEANKKALDEITQQRQNARMAAIEKSKMDEFKKSFVGPLQEFNVPGEGGKRNFFRPGNAATRNSPSAAGLGVESIISGAGSIQETSKIFSEFTNNFGRQVEALAAIPRTIDMNVNQRVEVIINGAGVLANLEPSMMEIANGAVKRAVEAIGKQLDGFGIAINYNPDEDKVNNKNNKRENA